MLDGPHQVLLPRSQELRLGGHRRSMHCALPCTADTLLLLHEVLQRAQVSYDQQVPLGWRVP